jgi:hypothetical protein
MFHSGKYLSVLWLAFPTVAIHHVACYHTKLDIFNKDLGLNILTLKVLELQRPQV